MWPIFWVKLANLGQLWLIRDPHINLQNFLEGLSDHKWAENINYTILQYGETFYIVSPVAQSYSITKTCLYNFDPLKPHFYIVKLGFTGVFIIFLISTQKHRLWVLVRTASPILAYLILVHFWWTLHQTQISFSTAELCHKTHKKVQKAVLTSTHNLCFEHKYEKYRRFLSENFQFYGGKIFNIFE